MRFFYEIALKETNYGRFLWRALYSMIDNYIVLCVAIIIVVVLVVVFVGCNLLWLFGGCVWVDWWLCWVVLWGPMLGVCYGAYCVR